MASDPTIRRATHDDVDAIRRVADAAWRAAYAELLRTETIDRALAEWYSPEAVERVLDHPDAAYFVASVEGGVRAYCSVAVDGEPARLPSIYVHPDRWGEGLGTALLERALAWADERGAETIELQVLAANDVGRGFYEAHGFEVVDEGTVDSFGEPCRELTYERRI